MGSLFREPRIPGPSAADLARQRAIEDQEAKRQREADARAAEEKLQKNLGQRGSEALFSAGKTGFDIGTTSGDTLGTGKHK